MKRLRQKSSEGIYDEALKNTQEVLELLSEPALANGEPLPEPKTLGQLFQLA